MSFFYNISKPVRLIFIVLGTFLMASSVKLIYEPIGMVTGGVSGLGIALDGLAMRYLGFSIPVFLTNIVINVPLFICAYKIIGREFAKNTLIAIISFTIMLAVIPSNEFIYDDYFLAAVLGGSVAGLGIGIIFSMNISTGGTDLLGMLIHEKMKYYSVPHILMAVDSVIVAIGAIVFGIEKAFYSIIAVLVTTKIADIIVEGGKFAKMVYIISDKNLPISEKIMYSIGRGITGIRIIGMFTKKEKNMLMCVVSKKELAKLSEIIAEIDINAFVIVCDVREVMGEGFIKIDNKP